MIHQRSLLVRADPMISNQLAHPGTALPLIRLKSRYRAPMSFAGYCVTLPSNTCFLETGCCRFLPQQQIDLILNPSMTRILILDDQAEFRKQLSAAITFSGLVVAGEAGSVPEALELLPFISVDLAIVDINLPGINGIEGTTLLKRAAPNLRVILVSAYSDQSALYMQAAVGAGAEGFISKDRLDLEVIKSWECPSLRMP